MLGPEQFVEKISKELDGNGKKIVKTQEERARMER